MVSKRFLSYPISYGPQLEPLIDISPEIITKQAFNKSSEELEEEPEFFNNTVVLKFDFNQHNVDYFYYSALNVAKDIGGYGFSIWYLCQILGLFMILLYLADLVALIRRKYKQNEQMYKIEALKKRMPLYRRVILEEIETYG